MSSMMSQNMIMRGCDHKLNREEWSCFYRCDTLSNIWHRNVSRYIPQPPHYCPSLEILAEIILPKFYFVAYLFN